MKYLYLHLSNLRAKLRKGENQSSKRRFLFYKKEKMVSDFCGSIYSQNPTERPLRAHITSVQPGSFADLIHPHPNSRTNRTRLQPAPHTWLYSGLIRLKCLTTFSTTSSKFSQSHYSVRVHSLTGSNMLQLFFLDFVFSLPLDFYGFVWPLKSKEERRVVPF